MNQITCQCKKHPKYKAIYKPRVDCQDCRDYYNVKHGNLDVVINKAVYETKNGNGSKLL